MTNNLFSYATSELSQDAFLCWLLSWAGKNSEKDEGLRACAVNLIKEIIPELTCPDEEIVVTEIRQQYEKVDVLFIVNDKYVVIVENKTHSGEHSNQLERYKKAIEKKYGNLEQRRLFFKTGFQGNTTKIREEGFEFIGLERIIKLFLPYVTKTSNRIFHDYFEFWNDFNNVALAYKNEPTRSWEWRQVNGFYRDLNNSGIFRESGFSTDFGYVANPSGGFHAMWMSDWNPLQYDGRKYFPYLQFEWTKQKFQLCLKINLDEGKSGNTLERKSLRDFLTYYTDKNGKWVYAFEEYGFSRPDRFGNGNCMTLGYIDIVADSYDEVIKGCLSTAINNFKEIKESIEARKARAIEENS